MIQPLGDRILVKPTEKKSTTSIIIPETARKKPVEGEVIAIGTGKLSRSGQLIPIDVKVGDKILYGKYAGVPIKLEGEEYVIMHEDDIFGILDWE